MGTYHTLFLARDDELDRLFPGWQPNRVLETPRSQEGVNPFTGKPMVFTERWEAVRPPENRGPLGIYTEASGEPLPPIEEPLSDYERMLEEMTPPGLRALPHVRWKNLPMNYVDAISELVLDREIVCPPIRSGPNDSDEDVPMLAGFPREAIVALAQLRDLDSLSMRVGNAFYEFESQMAADDYQAMALRLLEHLIALASHEGARDGWICDYVALHY